jgi:hypothetical protein
MVPTAVGDKAVEFQARFEAGRPPGIRPGSTLNVPLAINLGPLPLQPGRLYVWQLSIDGIADENWRASFQTRSPKEPASRPSP